MTDPQSPNSSGKAALGWVVALLALAYAAVLHHGIGPLPFNLQWYSPRGFLLDTTLLGPFQRNVVLGNLVLPGIAALLSVAVFRLTGSSVARLLSVTAVIATFWFCFYGLGERVRVWDFFHWRWSGAMLATAFVIAMAATAPLLARSLWGRPSSLRWILTALVYVPVVLAGVALERNATGTDDSLQFAISPWPAVSVFGLGLFASTITALYAGLALGLGVSSTANGANGPRRSVIRAAGIAIAAVVPAAWLSLSSRLGLLPFEAGPPMLILAMVLGGVIALAITLFRRGQGGAIGRLAKTFGLGVLFAATPLLAGQALTQYDYTITRDQHAQAVIDALAAYYEREYIYPDSLDALVEAGDIEALPKPEIGFSFLSDDEQFSYQALGTSYLLEFSASRWVQCAYSPPYEDEYEEEEEDEDRELESWETGEGESAGSWSCPKKPPELW